MVDERRVRRLLHRIQENLVYLVAVAAGDRSAVRADRERLAGLKYTFVVTIEGCIDVAQHLCASEGWGPPSDNADAVRRLGRRGVLPPSLAESVAGAVGFRNLLVHQYADVDDDLVVGAHLDHVGDLEAFVTTVSAWVERQAGTGG